MQKSVSKITDRSDSIPEQTEIQSIEQRLARLERRVDAILNIARSAPYESWRRRLRPRLWNGQQYSSRRLRIRLDYQSEKVPEDPPRIAIVTPSLNQRDFIASTIDSVINQNYPNLTYLVQDGGSTDGTRAILKRYDSKLRWRSEADTGQADAVNRGFREIDGEIMAYLNSDDILLPGTLAYVARVFRDSPDVDLVYGHRIYIDVQGLDIGRCVLPPHDPETLKWADFIPQETLFWRRRVWQAIGPLDESFQFALDWDFVLRAQESGFVFRRVPRFLSCFRVHDQQKGAYLFETGEQEMSRIRAQNLGEVPGQYEIKRAIGGYLVRQMICDWMYRLHLFRY
jgi:glycosyltransferase involved in cell wall biosynthesis